MRSGTGPEPAALHTMQFTTRQAVFADLDALAPLFDAYRQFYGQASDCGAARRFLQARFEAGQASDCGAARRFLQARFEAGQSVVFIAERAGEAVGFTQLFPSFSSVSMARAFVLNDLYVAEAARRQGVGEQLLDAAAHYARSVGAVRLSLSTAIDNLPAQALYERRGWARDQRFFAYHLSLAA